MWVSWLILLVLLALFALLLLKVSTSRVSVRSLGQPITSSSSPLNLAVLCVTWNTADVLPSTSEIVSLVPQSEVARHDIISIAFQETPSQGLLNVLHSHLDDQFTLIASESSRNAIHLAVFGSKKLMPEVANVQSGSETFGVPVFFRKGAAAVCFSVRSRRLLFLSVHLSAHEGQLDARNTDTLALFYRLQVACAQADSDLPLASRFDSAFLQGDLNYRITGGAAEALTLLGSTSFTPEARSALLERDELSIECRRPNGTYKGWREEAITFPPTYKFAKATPPSVLSLASQYDQKRTPSWCDRILYFGAKALLYESRDRGRSDHQPVAASFVI